MIAHRLLRRMALRGDAGPVRVGALGRAGLVATLLALCTVLAGAVAGTPRAGLQGQGLGVSLSAAVVLLAGLRLLSLRGVSAAEPPVVATSVLMGLGSAALAGLDPGSPAYLGGFVAVGAMSLRVRRSTAAWGAFVIVCATTAAFALSRSGAQATAIVSVDLGLVFVLAVAAFAREQQRLLAELREAEQARAQAAVLQERARLAREIHDVLAHSLTGLSVQLQGARLLLARDHPDHAALAQVERAEALARSGLEETRRAVGALRGDAMPGPEQLAALAEDFERDTGIPCRCEVSGQARPLAAEAGLAVYRTAQEALSNVRKHAAGAAEVVLRLRWSAGAAELTVADRVAGGMAQGNGSRGAASLAGTGGGYGLTGIRERAELLGGSLDAGPRDGGFAVCLRLPA